MTEQTWTTPRSIDPNPFVGPRPIQVGESLFGRDAETRELYNLLQARRIVVLHSPTGAGKTSLVQAGLIPRLKQAKYDVWRPIRLHIDPTSIGVTQACNRYLLSAMLSLEDELPSEHRRNAGELAKLDFLDYLRTRPRRKGREDYPVVLLFDQFEELLTVQPFALADKHEFITTLGRALEQSYRALFIIREDYLASLAPYRDRIPTQLTNTVRLELLSLADAREVAVELADEGRRSFPAVDQLIHNLSAVPVAQPDGTLTLERGPYVEPVHLQVVCRRLWAALPSDKQSIELEDLAAYADVSRSLADYYANTIQAIAKADRHVERKLRTWVGETLIVDGRRAQARRGPQATDELDNAWIEQLLDSYLVRAEQRAGIDWIELSHDRLIAPIQQDNRAWLVQDWLLGEDS